MAKLNWFDRLIGTISPSALNKRLVARKNNELITRQYDAAKNVSSGGVQRNNKNANKEINSALAPIRENARELVRNMPVAAKAVSVISNETISWGIEPTIKHDDKAKEAKVRAAFKEWSKNCGVDGANFYTLQSQVMTAMIVDGESILREAIIDGKVKLHLLEADYIATKTNDLRLDEKHRLINGVALDEYDRPQAYMLHKNHPIYNDKDNTVSAVPASQVIHVFKKDRPGQNRGVSWFAPVLISIKQLDQIHYTALIRQQLASSLTAIVVKEKNEINALAENERFQEDWALTPGSVMRLNPGESVTVPQIPNETGFDVQARNTMRLIASGLGMTYEALSSDLSQVNFSSARIGHLSFKKNIDSWRYHTIIPQFCDKAFQFFIKDCQIRGIDTTGVQVEWTPPAHTMVDVQAETNAMKDSIRSGLMTYPQALKEYGFDPEGHLKEIAQSNAKLDEAGIILDSDPRYIGNGQLASGDSLAQIQAIQKKINNQ